MKSRFWAGLAVVALLAAVYLSRYRIEVATVSNGSSMCWRLDRWTGVVEWVPGGHGRQWIPVGQP